MALERVLVMALMVSHAASIQMHTTSPFPPTVEVIFDGPQGQPRFSNQSSTERKLFQWSEYRLGPPMLESEICAADFPWSYDQTVSPGNRSMWKVNDPPIFPHAGIGARRRQPPQFGLDYQLFLPDVFTFDPYYPLSVVVYLHSHAERKWTLMNSQGLARMLARNQSTSFDNRSCWCLNATKFGDAMTYVEDDNTISTYSASPTQARMSAMADCTFADTFPAIVIMPQGWTQDETPGWTADKLGKVKSLTKYIIEKFNGNADNVVITGSVEGGDGAFRAAGTYDLFSSVIVSDSPTTTYASGGGGLEGTPVFVAGDVAASSHNDGLVNNLKSQRSAGVTRYFRYVEGPDGADPLIKNDGHAADLIYRDQELWQWAFHHKITGGRDKWGLDLPPFVVMK